jgi:hypothetical protein
MARTIEEIQRQYVETCAKLGDAVWQQRKLHTAAEHLIRQIEALEQEARGLSAEQPTNTPEPTSNDPVASPKE